MSKKFPKVIVIERQDDGDGGSFLVAHEKLEDAAVVGEKVSVAIYTLRDTSTVYTKVKLK